ncbi:MAG TPA: pyrroline-5-carboxylate reductase [Phycisphaerae bacterium]|nr:pyrroline-5-carboxylate reductase [Phycisphaerae bacterium]
MPTLAFIGAGNMAEAIARGLLRSALYAAHDLRACDPAEQRRHLFTDELNIHATADCRQAAAGADILLLAVKPFVMAEALAQLKPAAKPDALFISIAAGISTTFIESALGAPPAGANAAKGPRVIRVMPNTPMLVGKGMSALCRGRFATDADIITAEKIFNAGGHSVRLPESAIDAVTAVSGSGPAYVFFLAEALSAAGAAAGLPAAEAAHLARQTIIGAAALLEESKDSPAELRRKVTTPNGTTQAAIESLQSSGFEKALTAAVAAAAQRSKELGK